jgi:glycosyltransferase involved in cell wall biosynthesis
VLVVAHRLDVGGTEMHLSRVLPELRKRGLDVALFTLQRGGALEAKFVAAGVPVSGPERSGSRLGQSLRMVFQLRRQLRAMQPDIVHFFLPEPYLTGSLAAAGLPSLKRIMSRRSLADYQRGHPVLARIEHWLHRFTDALVGNSNAVVEELAAECGDRGKVSLIHNGIEMPVVPSAERRQMLRRDFGIPDDAFVIIVSANLIAYKGHADLLDALGRIKDRLRQPWRLLLVGRDQGIGAGLRQKAEALGIAGNIVWVETSVDADVALAADVSVLPSHQEGFSNSLLEAMACAVPVIATRVGGNPDAVVDGESGLLVPPRDPAALAAALVALHEDAALRRRLGDTARARVAALFSLPSCIEQYLALYKRVVADHIAPMQARENT